MAGADYCKWNQEFRDVCGVVVFESTTKIEDFELFICSGSYRSDVFKMLADNPPEAGCIAVSVEVDERHAKVRWVKHGAASGNG